MTRFLFFSTCMAFVTLASVLRADPPEIAEIAYDNGRFSVTLRHSDTGWDHYADGWRVEDAEGNVLGTRVLAHPHVNEQPFTRSHRIAVPDGLTRVFVRAKCSVDGWNETRQAFDLP